MVTDIKCVPWTHLSHTGARSPSTSLLRQIFYVHTWGLMAFRARSEDVVSFSDG